MGFSDETWLGRGGWFHSDQMRVIEKFTRTGNQLLYEVTVDDPEVLVEPWVMPARTRRLSNNPVIVVERGSCRERVERGLHANAALVLFLSIEDPCAGGPARPTTVVARNVSHNPYRYQNSTLRQAKLRLAVSHV